MPNNLQATELLRQFAENRALAVSGQDKRWRWRNGTLLFPEGRCCYCGAVVRSNRIWVVADSWLKGQLDVRGDAAKWERPYHPHSGTDGSLCTGGNDNLTALFFGVNPADPVRWRGEGVEAIGKGVRDWYVEMFGHTCGEGEALRAADGIFAVTTAIHHDRRPDCVCGCGCNPENGRCSCGHEDCECDEQFTCVNCEDRYDVDDRYGGPHGEDYCGDCYHDIYVDCDWCDRQMLRDDGVHADVEGEGTYCPDHATREQRGLPAVPEHTMTLTAATAYAMTHQAVTLPSWYTELHGQPVNGEPIALPAEPPSTATGEVIRQVTPRLPADMPPDNEHPF